MYVSMYVRVCIYVLVVSFQVRMYVCTVDDVPIYVQYMYMHS